MADSEIFVTLRAKMDKFAGDVKAGTANVNKNAGLATKAGLADIEKGLNFPADFGSKRLTKPMFTWTNVGKPQPPTPAVPPPAQQAQAVQATMASIRASMLKALGPTGTVITTAIAGIAALRVAMGLLRYSVGLVTAPFAVLARIVSQAAIAAAKLYSKSLQSGGMPVGLVSQRSTLASIIGVGEQEVWQYGEAVAYLNKRIEAAAAVTAKYNSQLTTTAWNTSVLKENWKSLMTSMAAEMAPIKDGVTGFFERFVRGLRVIQEERNAAQANRDKNAAWNRFAAKSGVKGMYTKLDGNLEDTFQNEALRNPQNAARLQKIKALFEKELSKGAGNVPNPAAMQKRFEASSWEKMGLILGMGQGVNYTAQTAKNTAGILDTLKRMTGGGLPRGDTTGISPIHTAA